MKIGQPTVELPSLEEINKMEKSDFLDAVNRFVVRKFQENKDKDSIEVTIDDIRNAAAIEEVNESDIESIKNLFEQKGIGVVFVNKEFGEKYFQFTMPAE
jgi:hypothetical protein